MHAEASYEPIVPMKVGNRNAGPTRGKGGTTHCIAQRKHYGTPMSRNMSTELERISNRARQDRALQFLSIAHNLTPTALLKAFKTLRKDASVGVDGITYGEYEMNASENIQKLHESIRSKTYRAKPLRRVYIPKEDGNQRAISIQALEDKIVQRRR